MLPGFKTSMTVPEKGHFGNKYYLRQTEKRDKGQRRQGRESEEVPQWLQFACEDTQNLTGDLTIFHIINISLPTSVSIDTQK